MSLAECFDVIETTLLAGYGFFAKGIANAGEVPPTQDDVVLSLRSIGELRGATTPMDFVTAIDRSRIYNLCCCLAVEPLLYSSGESTGASLQQTFVKVRQAALEAMSDIAATYAVVGHASPAKIASTPLLEALLAQIAAPASFETIRLSSAQTIFALCAAAPQQLPASLVQGLVQCCVLEPSPVARSVMLCVLRELCRDSTSNNAALQAEVGTFAKLLEIDESADVRTLAAEVLVSVMTPEVAAQPRDLIQAIRKQLDAFHDTETSPDERNAVAILVTTVCASNPGAVYPEVCRQHLYRSLLHGALATGAFQILAALRTVIDRCPAELRIGNQLLSDFESFSGLLKLILDFQGTSQDSSHGSERQMSGIEAASIVALLLAQSPGHRQHVRRELHAFPMWAGALRDALLHFLNMATLDFFSDLTMVDFSNVQLNALDNMEWNEQERPLRACIQNIFSTQESRFHEGAMLQPPRLTPPHRLTEQALRRQNKLAFVVLSYSVHATLSDDAATAHNPASPATGSRVGPGTPSMRMPSTFGDTDAAAAVRPAEGAPMFPTPYSASRSRTQATIKKDSLTAEEKVQMAYAYDRFDSSFKLTLQFAKYYGQASVKPTVYEPTPDGFVVRQAQLKNPWGPLVKKQQIKSWQVKDVKEGDLFYFAIPFNDLNQRAIEAVIQRAMRQVATLKKAFITTPQTARGRRWLLYDLIHHVMPAAMDHLKTLHRMLDSFGDENVRFPVFLFREKEMHLGERAIHSGNLVEVVDQVNFYFSQHPASLFGTPDDATAVAKLEERLRELATQANASGMHPDLDDEGGHGGISSDSEAD